MQLQNISQYCQATYMSRYILVKTFPLEFFFQICGVIIIQTCLNSTCVSWYVCTNSQSFSVKLRRWQWMAIRRSASYQNCSSIKRILKFQFASLYIVASNASISVYIEGAYSNSANLGSVVSFPW